jgi:hypothetical protein
MFNPEEDLASLNLTLVNLGVWLLDGSFIQPTYNCVILFFSCSHDGTAKLFL